MSITRTNIIFTVRVLTRPVKNPNKDGRRDGPDYVPQWPKGQRFVLRRYTQTTTLDAEHSIVEIVERVSEIRPQGGYNWIARRVDENGNACPESGDPALVNELLDASDPVTDFDALITIYAQTNVSPKDLLLAMWDDGLVGPSDLERAYNATLARWDAEDDS